MMAASQRPCFIGFQEIRASGGTGAGQSGEIALKFFKQLWVLVVIGAVLGIIVGAMYPSIAGTPPIVGLGEKMKPLGDAFVALIKMIIAPVIFCTVVAGIAHMNDAKAVGRV